MDGRQHRPRCAWQSSRFTSQGTRQRGGPTTEPTRPKATEPLSTPAATGGPRKKRHSRTAIAPTTEETATTHRTMTTRQGPTTLPGMRGRAGDRADAADESDRISRCGRLEDGDDPVLRNHRRTLPSHGLQNPRNHGLPLRWNKRTTLRITCGRREAATSKCMRLFCSSVAMQTLR